MVQVLFQVLVQVVVEVLAEVATPGSIEPLWLPVLSGPARYCHSVAPAWRQAAQRCSAWWRLRASTLQAAKAVPEKLRFLQIVA